MRCSIRFPGELQDGDVAGGKARALHRLSRGGFRVPAWFVITGVHDDHNEPCQTLSQSLARLPSPSGLYAVRSSAAVEDGAEHSFAGQFESHLDVPREKVLEKVLAVWQSASSDRVRAYCRERQLAPPAPPRIIVMEMLVPDSAGVAFSACPVTGRRRHCVISAVAGCGEKLVSGESDADTCRVAFRGNEGEEIEYLSCSPDGSRILSPNRALEVAKLAKACEAFFGVPQDIEWAFQGGVLYLLQSRPVTSLDFMPDPDDPLLVWDNSNIVESYSGVTTPMTYSFARRIYASVYREFCKLMRVPRGVVAAHDDTFENMLGLIRGRVYYHLVNWYRVLAMLPGFQVNRAFMEQMMGVREPLPAEIVNEIVEANRVSRSRDALRLTGTLGGLVWNHLTLGRQARLFQKRLDEALLPPPDLPAMDLEALRGHYLLLESKLLTRWDAPLVNDFLAMIFFGVLGKLTRAWLCDEDGGLHNALIAGGEDIISLEPAKRIREMAQAAMRDAVLLENLHGGAKREELAENHPAFSRLLEGYIEKFGERCLEELKLESQTLDEAPELLIQSVANLARRYREEGIPQGQGDRALRLAAEERVRQAPLSFFRRRIFARVLKNARDRVRDRENLRFERTRLFGRVRRILREMGRRFAGRGALDNPNDVFYLRLEEVLGEDGPFQERVEARKKQFEEFRQGEPPPERFLTRGSPGRSRHFEAAAPAPAASISKSGGQSLRGIGCCPGKVRGKVRLVSDPRNSLLVPGEILVARQTDPGWVMLFPSAAALLVERGSLLSHSAIVSREMGIPAIVSLPGLFNWIKNGEWVEMDGSTGEVSKIEP